jgi:hypothetical protein
MDQTRKAERILKRYLKAKGKREGYTRVEDVENDLRVLKVNKWRKMNIT